MEKRKEGEGIITAALGKGWMVKRRARNWAKPRTDLLMSKKRVMQGIAKQVACGGLRMDIN
jgi:hypothetical protein